MLRSKEEMIKCFKFIQKTLDEKNKLLDKKIHKAVSKMEQGLILPVKKYFVENGIDYSHVVVEEGKKKGYVISVNERPDADIVYVNLLSIYDENPDIKHECPK